MNEVLQDKALDELPESHIKPRAKFSIVWLVPLVAVLIALWIGYKAWSEMGPTIRITFKTADGLEAGKTKIKFKNVEMGTVKTISINTDSGQLDNITVTAEVDKMAAPYLTDKTRFWVVRARIAASGVSGLETLLSGAFIGVDPSDKGKKTHDFTGLEIPPVVTSNIPGKHFILHAESLGSLERDVPVYFRRFNVGLVEDVRLAKDGKSVTVRVFVRAPFDQWVNSSTKFWNASGIDFSTTTSGINVKTESLVSIIIGGIAFESDASDKVYKPSQNMSEFKLFSSREASLKKDYKIGLKYVSYFSESVRGLNVGSPVEFRGIQLGEVTDIELQFDTDNNTIRIPVTMTADYGRMALKGNKESAQELYQTRIDRVNYFIKQGLRAQLKTGNLLTGQLLIDVDFFPDAPPYVIDWNAKIPEFPTVPSLMGELTHDITNILKKADAVMNQAQQLSYKLNHDVAPELSLTLQQTQQTLATLQDTLENDSPLQQDLQMALREVTKAARSVKSLADYLERHPESLIEGKK